MASNMDSDNSIDLLIEPRWIIPMTAGARVLQAHCVAINNGRIVDIVPTHQQRYQPRQHVKLEQHAVLPGLINTHTHSAMSLLRGYADDMALKPWLETAIWPAEAKHADVRFVVAGTQLAAAEYIQSGTTTFVDMYFFPDKVAQQAQQTGLRTCVGFPVMEFPTAWAQGPDDYLHKGMALCDEFKNDPLVSILFGPHAPYTVADETWRKIRMYADELELPVQAHINETQGEVHESLAQYQVKPLQRLDQLGMLTPDLMAVHMTALDDEDIELIANRGIHVVHCPESNLKLASGFCPVGRLQSAGVNVTLGTDGAASNNDLSLLNEMRTAALLAKAVAEDATAVDAYSALQMATINAAKALQLDDTIGSIEIGKAADLIAIDLDQVNTQPLYDPIAQIVYAANDRQITHSWVAGRCLMQERTLQTLNTAQLLTQAREWQQKIQPDQANKS